MGVLYWGGRQLAQRQAAPFLTTELSKLLGRPIEIGKIEDLSLQGIEVGPSRLPPIPEDQSTVTLQGLKLEINPLLFLVGKPVVAQATLVKPVIDLVQDAQGRWLVLDPPKTGAKSDLPLDLDLKVKIDSAQIRLRPYQGKPLYFTINGAGRYQMIRQGNRQIIDYDVNAGAGPSLSAQNSRLQAKGQTVLNTGQTQTDLTIERLNLPELASLIPNFPARVQQGELAGQVKATLPSLKQIEGTQTQGALALENLQAQFPTLKAPLRANLNLGLTGQKIQVQKGEIQLGDLRAQVRGGLDWRRGYDLRLQTNAVEARSLFKTLAVTLPVSLQGRFQAQAQISGALNNPVVQGKIENINPVTLDRVPIQTFQSQLRASLTQVTLKSLQIRPQAGGEIYGAGDWRWRSNPLLRGRFRADLPSQRLLAHYQVPPQEVTLGDLSAVGAVAGTLAKPEAQLTWRAQTPTQLGAVALTGEGKAQWRGDVLTLTPTRLRTSGGELLLNGQGNFRQNRWRFALSADKFALSPLVAILCANPKCPPALARQPLTLERGDLVAAGQFKDFSPRSLESRGDLILRSGADRVRLQGELNRGELAAQLQTETVALNPWLPNLPIGAEAKQGRLTLGGTLTRWQAPALAKLQGRGQFKVALANASQPIRLQTELQDGLLSAAVQAKSLNLNALAPTLPLPTRLTRGQISLSVPLQSLLASPRKLENLEAIASADLDLNGGAVTSLSRLNPQGWQSRLRVKEVDLSPLNSSFNQPLNGVVHLRGAALPPSLKTIPLEIETARLRLGAQFLQASGHLTLAPNQPAALRDLNLTIGTQVDLQTLPVNTLVAQLPLPSQFRPPTTDLTGLAHFRGRVQGQTVKGLADLRLTGKLDLKNPVLNGYALAPQLTGAVEFNPRRTSSLILRGEKDYLNLALAPLAEKLLPTAVDLRLGSGQETPIQAQVKRQGDQAQFTVTDFPLALLNLQPGRDYQFLGPLRGQLRGQGAVNLQDFSGQGDLTVDQLGLGALVSQQFQASLAYQDRRLDLTDAQLRLGQGQYRLEGSLDLASQAVSARLQADGKVNEVLGALRLQDIDALMRLSQKRPAPLAQDLPSLSLGNSQRALEHQLNLLYVVDQRLRALAEQRRQGGAPKELNIDGHFRGEAVLGGTLSAPELDLSLRGKGWSWYPQSPFVDIAPPLGVTLNSNHPIPINEVNLQARLENGVVTVPPSFVEIRSARLALEGEFSPKGNDARWAVENLSSDTFEALGALPLELVGTLNAQGLLRGTWAAPQLQGAFKLDELSLKARSLVFNTCPEESCVLAGNFSYAQNQFRLLTDRQSPLFISAQIPFHLSGPPLKNKQFNIQAHIREDAFQLLGPLTNDQVTWVGGEGDLNLGIQGILESGAELKLKDFQALGKIQLQRAVIKSAALPNPIEMNGEIEFNDRVVSIAQLKGNFGQGEVLIQGNLPIFTPQANLADPLTVNLDPTQVNFPDLYRGEVGGVLEIKGSAFAPQLAGNLRLAGGQIFIPDSQAAPAKLPDNFWIRQRRLATNGGPTLNHLNISLDNLSIAQDPLYSFAFGGELTLNGPLTDFNRLRPEGQIDLHRGRVSFLDTRFLLDRRTANGLTFTPEGGLLNPDLKLAMRTIVSDLPQSQRLRSADSNEIPDDSITKIQRVDIRLVLDGPLSRILPNLSPRNAEICNPEQTFRPLSGDGALADYQLANLSQCLQVLAAQGFNNEQIFANPAVQLSSSPPRSEGEIVRLLGEQALVLVDALQGKNANQLLQVGITQLAIPMIFQGLVYDVETALSNQLRTTDFRVVPFLEAIYTVEKNGYLRFSYDYSVNEVRLRYEKQF
jgi:translocation and assembly module TamB